MNRPHIGHDPAQARRSRRTKEALDAIKTLSRVAYEYDYLDAIHDMLEVMTEIVELNASE